MKRVITLLLVIVAAACTEAPLTAETHVVVFFDPGSATPKETGKKAIAYFIEKYTQEAKASGHSADVSVVGHADATGDAAANEKLSLRRAQAVAGLLAQGVAPQNARSRPGDTRVALRQTPLYART